eukprot:6878331-Lingulodinium_polyedra.AAC.1
MGQFAPQKLALRPRRRCGGHYAAAGCARQAGVTVGPLNLRPPRFPSACMRSCLGRSGAFECVLLR